MNMCDRFKRNNRDTWIRHIKALDDIEREAEEKKQYRRITIGVCVVMFLMFIVWNVFVTWMGWY